MSEKYKLAGEAYCEAIELLSDAIETTINDSDLHVAELIRTCKMLQAIRQRLADLWSKELAAHKH